jgi:serine/threonine protein kinase/tetratricopeptide (TPR) repeat protein
MFVEPGATLARYRLLEKIGNGGMGVVWKALDPRLGREIAIKLLPEELATDEGALSSFEREARAIAALNHPNIVTIHSVEETEGVHFFTMELLTGLTLRELIPAGGMAVDRLLEIALAVTGALGAAHARGIVHRDLKPANVMITREGQVKLFDFGLAKMRQAGPVAADTDWSTAVGAREDRLAGTLLYMSPEQVRGWSVDQRTDIFALGVVLYEMLTGRRPFGGQTVQTLTAAILMDAVLPPSRLRPELPRGFDDVVVRCTEKDRALRLQTAEDVRGLLVRVRNEDPPTDGGPVPSIAVLPFTDMSQERDQDWFCEGIAEEVITSLAQLRNLRVASRISSFQFKGAPLDSREIGRRLGVRHLLSGSVRKAGGRLRIAIELTDVEAGFCLWSERYDRDLKDIFAVQEEIATKVVQAFRLTPGTSRREALGRLTTSDVEAYELYLKGRMYFYQYSRKGIEFARQLFTRAVERDPGYALAHAGLADCCTFLFMYVVGGEETRAAAIEAGRRAVELGPGLAQAHVSLGIALSLTRDHEAAEREFETALGQDPRLFEAHYFYARDCFMRGELQKALKLYEQASELRPEDYQSPLLVGQIYEDLRRPELAEAARRRGLQAAETRLALHPDDVRACYMGANALVALGERERGLEWALRAYALDPGDAMLLYNLACIFSMAARVEEALDFLERSVRAGMNRLAWLQHDSNLDAIRGHARFQAVTRALEAQAPPG